MSGSTSVPLYQTATVLLDANGAGQVVLQPGQQGVWWEITTIAISTTQADPNSTNIPTVILYRGYVGNTQIGGTFSGVMDNANGDTILNPNEPIWVVWTGADPNQTGRITVAGTEYYPGTRYV